MRRGTIRSTDLYTRLCLLARASRLHTHTIPGQASSAPGRCRAVSPGGFRYALTRATKRQKASRKPAGAGAGAGARVAAAWNARARRWWSGRLPVVERRARGGNPQPNHRRAGGLHTRCDAGGRASRARREIALSHRELGEGGPANRATGACMPLPASPNAPPARRGSPRPDRR
jgi:hypothetical protein